MKWYEKIDWLCGNKVIYNEIYNEVECCPFISVEADETTDCAMYAQLSIIIRYVHQSKIIEIFMGFFDVSNDKSALRLADVWFQNRRAKFRKVKSKKRLDSTNEKKICQPLKSQVKINKNTRIDLKNCIKQNNYLSKNIYKDCNEKLPNLEPSFSQIEQKINYFQNYKNCYIENDNLNINYTNISL
ncbi:hypothetical protein A3Q56_03936 [Intoshia linei]|uniref:Uncharacterized protein n=1 Tax=Intoshia linei TaxID=1819745 RepID=A0A177B3L0_9BILA|nr:hypothetical protein A3Q56_03936 [Intoshia linei]